MIVSNVEKMQQDLIEVFADTLEELQDFDLSDWSDPNEVLESVLNNVRRDIGTLNNNPYMYFSKDDLTNKQGK